MKRQVLALVFVGLGWSAAAEPTWTPLFSGRWSTDLATSSVEAIQVPLETHLDAEAGVDFAADLWRGKLLGGIESRPTGTTWSLSEAWVSAGEGGPFLAQAGWWPDRAGPALFHSVVPTFTAAAGTDFLATAGGSRARSPLKGALRGTWDEWSLEAEVNPWVESPALPDVGSVWFPRKDIVPKLSIWLTDYYFGTIAAVEAPGTTTGWTTSVPWKLEGRWSALWGDLSLGVFGGEDPVAVYPGTLVTRIFSDGSVYHYDLTLQASRNWVAAAWATVEVPWEGGKVWAEETLTKDRLAIDTTLAQFYQGAFSQLTRTTDTSETVAGASYSFSWGSWGTLRTWTEGLWYRDLRDGSRTPPDFSQGAEVGLHWDHPQGLGSLDVMGGTPWDPTQGWVLARATWNWTEGRSLWAACPWFWGAPTSMWGQFADRRLFAVGAAWDQ